MVISSSIPTVKLFLGASALRLSNTDFTIEGVVSFEASPYLPPTIKGLLGTSMYAPSMSKWRGS